MSSNRNVDLNNIKNKETRIINVLTDQEEVAYQFKKYAMVSAPVVNEYDVIIGSITVDDVVDVIEEEREEDILKLGGNLEKCDSFDDKKFSLYLQKSLDSVVKIDNSAFIKNYNEKFKLGIKSIINIIEKE